MPTVAQEGGNKPYVSLTSCGADVAYDSFTAKTTDKKATP